MKIAFTSTGPGWDSIIDARFGRTNYIVMYDEESHELSAVDNSAVKDVGHGAGTATAQKIYDLKPDVLITGNGPGETASKALRYLKMRVFVEAHDMTLGQAYEQYKLNRLKQVLLISSE